MQISPFSVFSFFISGYFAATGDAGTAAAFPTGARGAPPSGGKKQQQQPQQQQQQQMQQPQPKNNQPNENEGKPFDLCAVFSLTRKF